MCMHLQCCNCMSDVLSVMYSSVNLLKRTEILKKILMRNFISSTYSQKENKPIFIVNLG